MSTNLNIWIESPLSGKNVQAQDVFALDDQRIDGFQAGKPASSIRVNSALRQSSILTVGLAEHLSTIDSDAWSNITLLSTVAQVTLAIKKSFDSIEANTLNKANTYTNQAEARTNTKISNLQSAMQTSDQNLQLQINNLQQTFDQFSALFNPFERDIESSQWTGDSAPYTYTIPASTHLRGTRPRIYTYVNGEETYDSPRIDMNTGDITLYSNSKLALKVVIY